ncbi:nucleotide disphospho-sugar-binding domain-containing protein [Dactylosporangium sp. McL0621]|uniref:nucleotide disphospho-sugar-binding domain-containing protein n=1 Tax=Dactylosporangium sp. McL0621 TaxID=3415678 RepID=UPI003CE956C6
MRVLVTTCPAHGHFLPLVSLCWSLRAAGHDVLVATPEPFVAYAATAGLPVVAATDPFDPRAVMRPEPATDRLELLTGTGRGFGRLAARTVDGLAGLVGRWRPDLLVTEPTEYAGPIAAAAHGVPYAIQTYGIASRRELHEAAHAELAPVYARFGLAGRPRESLYLDVCPAQLQLPDQPAGVRMRYVPYNGAADVTADIPDPGRPLAVVTAGSFLGRAPAVQELLRGIVADLGGLGLAVALAVDPAVREQLGPLPAHVVAAGWLSLDQVLPRAAVAVHHGGAGTTMTCAAHGVPQLALPFVNDNFDHGERVAATGAGRCLPGAEAEPAAVRAVVRELLDDPAARPAAARLAADNAAAPAPPALVPALEALAFAGVPA